MPDDTKQILDPRERFSDPEETDRISAESTQANIFTAMPVVIKKHDHEKNAVHTQIATKLLHIDNGKPEWKEIAKNEDIPVYYPGGGGAMITFPVQDGDEGLMVMSSRSIDKWWQQGGVQEQSHSRMHDVSDGFCFPGFYSQPNKVPNVNTKTLQIRTRDGKSFFEFNPATKPKGKDGKEIETFADEKPSLSMNIEAKISIESFGISGNVTAKASRGNVVLDSPGVRLGGPNANKWIAPNVYVIAGGGGGSGGGGSGQTGIIVGPITLSQDVTGSGDNEIPTTVVGLRNRPIATMAPLDGQSLRWSESNHYWYPATIGGDGSGGTVGPPGPQGPPGPTGPPGPNASTISTAETPPASPQSGWLWWDSSTDAGQLYVYYIDPTGPGQWVAATNSPGPPGATGAAGPTGAQGVPGPPGPQGPTGPSGGGTITLTGDITGSGTSSINAEIAANAVGTPEIANSAVTYAKVQNVTAVRLLGNPTGSATPPSEIILGTNLSFAGNVLNATGSGGGGSGDYLPLTGGTLSGGLGFGSAASSGSTDLSRHINLHTAGYGFSVTTDRLNYVSDGSHIFLAGGSEIASISPTGNLFVEVPNNLSGTIKISNTIVGGPGASVGATLEAVGVRGDGNGSFDGRFAVGFRRTDGSPIDNGYIGRVGTFAFGGQWGTDQTYQQSKMLYPASIQGLVEGAYTSANNMPTALSFRTGLVGEDIRAPNTSFGTERMRIRADGNVLVARMLTVGSAGAPYEQSVVFGAPDASHAAIRGNSTNIELIRADGLVYAYAIGATAAPSENSGVLATTAWVRSFVGGGDGYLPLTGGTLSGGLHFGSTTSSGQTDLSRHIDLWGGLYGFSITGARLNYNVDVGGNHVFVKNGVDVGYFDGYGLHSNSIRANAGGAGSLADLHVGKNAGTARVYNTLTDQNNGEWAYIGSWANNIAYFGTDKNGSGATRNVAICVGGINKLEYGSAVGNPAAFVFTDSQIVIGTNAPLYLYTQGFAVNEYYNGSIFVYGPGSSNQYAGSFSFDTISGSFCWWGSAGPGNAGANANMAIGMAFKISAGGNPLLSLGIWPDWSANFPALRRSGNELQVRFADDSAYGIIRSGIFYAEGTVGGGFWWSNPAVTQWWGWTTTGDDLRLARSGTGTGTALTITAVTAAVNFTGVVSFQGRPFADIAPTTNQSLIWSGTAWIPGTYMPYTVAESDARYVNVTGDTMTGSLTISVPSYPTMTLNAATGGMQIIGQRNGLMRWLLRVGSDDAESGGNTGSDFTLHRYNDSGVLLAEGLRIKRDTGAVTIGNTLSVGSTAAPANTSVGMIWMSGTLVHNGGTAIFHNAVPTSAGTKHISTGAGAAFNMGGAQFAFYTASGNAGAEVVWNLVGTLDASQLYVNSNIKIAGNYLTFVNSGYTVNTTGGPLIYADTSTMVFKQGSNGPNGFWWQNYTGYIVARITGDTAHLQLFQVGSTVNYVELYNDGNSHLNTPNGLYINWWSQQVANFGGDINAYNSKYIYARGGRLRAHQGGNDNNYLEMFDDGNAHINSNTRIWINYYSGNETAIGGNLIIARNNYGINGTDTGGGTSFMMGILNDNLLWIGDSTHAINFQSGGTIPWLVCNGRLDNNGQIWCASDIIMGNEAWLYGRTNGNNYYNILGAVGNAVHVGNGTWDINIRAASTIVAFCHARPEGNNTRYSGHGGYNWYQVSAYNFYNPSDASLKHDIAEAPSCLDVVAAIKPKTYKYNDSPDTRTHWGFIAQDVAAAMREAGHADFGGHIPVDEMNHHEGLAYHELTAVLWRAVQELSAEVAELKGRLH